MADRVHCDLEYIEDPIWGLRGMRRFNANASVIFDEAEPVGQATDLVMPRRRWFRRRGENNLPPAPSGAAQKSS